ncbi:MAG: hypothetical protein ACTHY8_10760 [Microbacterium gubbeenense]|uniref:hypothetical protein n=1 Tax=Microbacterium gubbeenense TaxID=159896 RepID=UPI000426981A|nr:hypothetical protein [Microbacterium gubbeenense]
MRRLAGIAVVAATSWSAGTVERERGEELEAAFARADEALYRAKRGGSSLYPAE